MATPEPSPERSTNRVLSPDLARYARQTLCEHLDEAAQRRLLASRVAIVGCGGLGSVIANTLTRAGIGFLRIIDPDRVELSNLQRQVLFDQSDAAGAIPKAQAAARHLASVNTDTTIEPHVARLDANNAELLLTGVNLILDGTDNFPARFIINDVAVKHAIPWVHGACAGTAGMVLTLRPPSPPCLRCIWQQPPPADFCPTSETAGILSPAVNTVASLQVIEAIKILTDHPDATPGRLLELDVWAGRITPLIVNPPSPQTPCACCGEHRFEYLAR